MAYHEWLTTDLKREMVERRKYLRSLLRAKEPNIHEVENEQKTLSDIRCTLNNRGIYVRPSKYEVH